MMICASISEQVEAFALFSKTPWAYQLGLSQCQLLVMASAAAHLLAAPRMTPSLGHLQLCSLHRFLPCGPLLASCLQL